MARAASDRIRRGLHPAPPDSADKLRRAAAGLPRLRSVASTPPRRCSARARPGAAAIFVGEEPGDWRTVPAGHSSAPRGGCSTRRWQPPASTADDVYLTNAVKHFKFVRRELVQAEAAQEADRRRGAGLQPWLEEEIRLVRPRARGGAGEHGGAGAAGKRFRVTQHRGEVVQSEWAGPVIATVHPSSVLRAPRTAPRREARREFFRDIAKVARYLGASPRVTRTVIPTDYAHPERSEGPRLPRSLASLGMTCSLDEVFVSYSAYSSAAASSSSTAFDQPIDTPPQSFRSLPSLLGEWNLVNRPPLIWKCSTGVIEKTPAVSGTPAERSRWVSPSSAKLKRLVGSSSNALTQR